MSLKKKLSPKTKSPPSPIKNKHTEEASRNSSPDRKKLAALRSEHIQLLASIGKLLADRSVLGKPVLSPPENDEIDPESVKATITEDTKKLEMEYKTLHDEFIANVNNDPYDRAKTLGWNFFAGAAAFGTSFLITNTISRIAPPWFSYAAPVVAGTLHAVVATPTAKSLMRKVWRGKALAESNNYFRLLGAYWSDNARGQTEAAKYVHKNPNKKDLIPVQERLAEERSLLDILIDRYKAEELSYCSYSVMYSVKGMIEAYLPPFLNYSATGRNIVDIGPHALAGAISGALYLAGQQHFRSALPANTVDVMLPPEVYAAQAKEIGRAHV